MVSRPIYLRPFRLMLVFLLGGVLLSTNVYAGECKFRLVRVHRYVVDTGLGVLGRIGFSGARARLFRRTHQRELNKVEADPFVWARSRAGAAARPLFAEIAAEIQKQGLRVRWSETNSHRAGNVIFLNQPKVARARIPVAELLLSLLHEMAHTSPQPEVPHGVTEREFIETVASFLIDEETHVRLADRRAFARLRAAGFRLRDNEASELSREVWELEDAGLSPEALRAHVAMAYHFVARQSASRYYLRARATEDARDILHALDTLDGPEQERRIGQIVGNSLGFRAALGYRRAAYVDDIIGLAGSVLTPDEVARLKQIANAGIR